MLLSDREEQPAAENGVPEVSATVPEETVPVEAPAETPVVETLQPEPVEVKAPMS